MQAGFGAYSEGISDDLNKAIWSGLYSDPTRTVEDIVRHYSIYYTRTGSHPAQSAVILEQLIFGLEESFAGGMLEDNTQQVMNALSLAVKLQQTDKQAVEGNWRLEAFIHRAFFDAYVLSRVEYEGMLLDQAREMLAVEGGAAQSKLAELLARSITGLSAPAKELKNQTLRMASSLKATLGSTAILQCQVPNLGSDTIDNRISDVQFVEWLAQKQLLHTPGVVAAWLNYSDPGPDGFFDIGGSVRADDHPHLDRGQGALSDPSSYFTPIQAVHAPKHHSENSMPFNWFQFTEVYYDNSLRFFYQGLNPNIQYTVTIVFQPNSKAPLRITSGTTTIRDYFIPDQMPVAVPIPVSVTHNGSLVLEFNQPPGLAGSGRTGLVSDIWLHRADTILGAHVLAAAITSAQTSS